MKKVLALILAILMLACLFAGCSKADESSNSSSKETTSTSSNDSSKDTASADAAPTTAKKEVACLFRISDMYAAWLKSAFEADAANYDDMNVTVFDNQDDSAKHIELIETCIEQGYDYIVVQGRQGDLSSIYQKAKDAGIKMIQINYAEEWSYDVLHTVLCDEIELGKIIAADAAEKLPENAQICILNGPAGNYVTEQRREGFQQGLLDVRPDITLLDEQNADFVKDTAMNKTSDWLQVFDQIDCILSSSDSMAVGAIEAYNANNVDTSNTLFYGIDGLTEACTAIMDGTMEGSALQDATLFSKTALGLIEQDIAGEIDLNEMVGSKEKAITLFNAVLLDESNGESQYNYYKELGMVN